MTLPAQSQTAPLAGTPVDPADVARDWDEKSLIRSVQYILSINGATGGAQEGCLFRRLHHAQLPNHIRGEAHLRRCAAACKRRLNAQDKGCPESVRDRNANG